MPLLFYYRLSLLQEEDFASLPLLFTICLVLVTLQLLKVHQHSCWWDFLVTRDKEDLFSFCPISISSWFFQCEISIFTLPLTSEILIILWNIAYIFMFNIDESSCRLYRHIISSLRFLHILVSIFHYSVLFWRT